MTRRAPRKLMLDDDNEPETDNRTHKQKMPNLESLDVTLSFSPSAFSLSAFIYRLPFRAFREFRG